MLSRSYIYGLIAVILGLCSVQTGQAQFVLSSGAMGMGGGSSARLAGIEAVNHNPANTYLASEQPFQIQLFSIGVRYDPLISRSTLPAYARQFKQAFSPYLPGSSVGNVAKGRLLSFNYPEQAASARYFNQIESTPLAVRFQNDSYSLTLSFRTHMTSRFRVGRGWYTDEPQRLNGDLAVINRTLSHRFQTFHEISLAYAQPLTMLNGLTPSFNRWYVGLAPTLTLGGTYFNAHYSARYHKQGQQFQVKRRSLHLQSSGTFSRVIRQMQRGFSVRQAITDHLTRPSLLSNTGYGFGVNFGITYQQLFNLNQKRTTNLNSATPITQYSDQWRFSIALRDVGIFRHIQKPLTIQYQGDPNRTLPYKSMPLADDFFNGAPGQFLYYLDEKTPAPDIIENSHSDQNPILQRLSGRFQVGTALLFNNISLSADASVPLSNKNRIDPPFTLNGGIVFNPLKNWELQSGMQLVTGQPVQFTMGTGYSNDNWSVSTAVQLSAGDRNASLVPRGAALTTLTLHL